MISWGSPPGRPGRSAVGSERVGAGGSRGRSEDKGAVEKAEDEETEGEEEAEEEKEADEEALEEAGGKADEVEEQGVFWKLLSEGRIHQRRDSGGQGFSWAWPGWSNHHSHTSPRS
jgi:hypothetical protein